MKEEYQPTNKQMKEKEKNYPKQRINMKTQ